MSRIRARRMTDREAMWARHAMAVAFQDDAAEAKRIGNEARDCKDVNDLALKVLFFAVDARDLAERALHASRRCSRLRLRGGR